MEIMRETRNRIIAITTKKEQAALKAAEYALEYQVSQAILPHPFLSLTSLRELSQSCVRCTRTW